MTFALISGVLFRAPEQKTSQAGKPYVVAKVRTSAGEWWRVTTFSESAQAELMRLADGDAVSAQGRLDAQPYLKDGEPKVGLALVADHVLALRQPPKQKAKRTDRATPTADSRSRQERCRGVADRDLNDDIPF
ncbi:MAG: single-stranded DNA-binding protein [Rhodoblastus sp.]